jgi:tRNA nucleotidyltransferase (CCA-adding enzyme)
MSRKFKPVLSAVVDKVTPNQEDREELATLADKLKKTLRNISKQSGIEAQITLAGSVAKDTWLKEEPDIDIFMCVPTTIPRESLGEICLEIARKATAGLNQVERFAEHPYLEVIADNIRINIVPCYNVRKGKWISATDRTPFHTEYVKERLTENMKCDIRLLKKFMKGIGVYGAEIRVGGFSGYLCELLILKHKSFLNTLNRFAKSQEKIVIDIEGYYEGRTKELELLFREPLVMVDPVDKVRNVASAVRAEKLQTFIAAGRVFLKNPQMEFFFPSKIKVLSAAELRQHLIPRGSDFIFLIFGKMKAVPDVLWGQLYRTQHSLQRHMMFCGFNVLRSISWSNENTINMFLFELENLNISPIRKHLGPPLTKRNACESFLLKHIDNPRTISGPYIEEGRWVVKVRRRYSNVISLLKKSLVDGGREIGVAEKVSNRIREELTMYVNEEIIEVYEKNVDFAEVLTEFLDDKPRWLKYFPKNQQKP